MNNRDVLRSLSKDALIELIELQAKNWLALDGVWFQSVERAFGMDEAMRQDVEAWRRYGAIEAGRLKAFLKLPERPGLEGLAQALSMRLYSSVNDYELIRDGDRLVFRNVNCRVQAARARKGMPFHPCKAVGIVEYAGFAAAIDDRIRCRCLSCYPDVTDEAIGCAWEFRLEDAGAAPGKGGEDDA